MFRCALFSILSGTSAAAITQQTLEGLKEIVSRCKLSHRIRNAPLRFRNVRFNARAYIDVIYLDGKPVLHIVDEAMRFYPARFLTKMSKDAIWDSIVLCWSSVYTRLPDNIMVDEGSQFRKVFAELAALRDVNIQKSGVESHNSLGIGGPCHKPLTDTYRKLKLDYPSMQRQLLLALAVKVMNDTLGTEGIVPSAFVFGEFRSLRSLRGPAVLRPSLAERAEAAQQARQYMS